MKISRFVILSVVLVIVSVLYAQADIKKPKTVYQNCNGSMSSKKWKSKTYFDGNGDGKYDHVTITFCNGDKETKDYKGSQLKDTDGSDLDIDACSQLDFEFAVPDQLELTELKNHSDVPIGLEYGNNEVDQAGNRIQYYLCYTFTDLGFEDDYYANVDEDDYILTVYTGIGFQLTELRLVADGPIVAVEYSPSVGGSTRWYIIPYVAP
jgi:hypothetical protein